MNTRTDPLPGTHLRVAIGSVHICEHPNHVAETTFVDLAEVRYCLACNSNWSELGTRGHHWPLSH